MNKTTDDTDESQKSVMPVWSVVDFLISAPGAAAFFREKRKNPQSADYGRRRLY
ncbi:MAG: hypothetical protein LBD47_06920 [Treponema sp.]|jgi:hypothetical protein|nr:hypothetical protein [Treponema sp.]